MFKKGDKVLLQGRVGEVIQADPGSNRFVVRTSTGSPIPVTGAQLQPFTGEIPDSIPATGPSGPPVALGAIEKLAMEINAWVATDGFGFHRLLREADTLGLVDHPELSQITQASVSSIRNWIAGSLRPTLAVMRTVFEHILSNVDSRDIRQELEAQEAETDAVLQRADAQEAPGHGVLSAAVAQALTRESQFIEVRGRSLTVDYTILEDGGWKAEIVELPGLMVKGASKMEALFSIKAQALDRIEKTIPRK